MLVVALVDYKRVNGFLASRSTPPTASLLVYTRIFGRVVNGARSWLGIGELGIQPSEFAKIATILFLATYLDRTRHTVPARLPAVLLGSLPSWACPMLLVLSQPDFGTALVFIPIFLRHGLHRRPRERGTSLFLLSTVASSRLVLVVLPLWERNIAARPTGSSSCSTRAPTPGT
ncbi:MAG: FtsW/RodA/SpoVE family cell cycle protein [Bacillus subtilis]|nr:FtsW/RodA/SpoVE family cell cycle protein [Bacillus subtilis]